MRRVKKSSIYRNEVTQAATRAVLQAVQRFESGSFKPSALASLPAVRGRLRPLMKQDDRRLDWTRDSTETVMRKVNAADGFPGVADSLFGAALPPV